MAIRVTTTRSRGVGNGQPLLDIKAVTSVCGNQTIQKTTYNAGRIMTLVGLDVPLAMGRVKPLVADAIIAPTVHGNSGLDGPALPEPKNKPVEIDACTLMAQVLEESSEPVVLIPTGR
jgi:pyrimidine-specific ribonucleoside hydrolase